MLKRILMIASAWALLLVSTAPEAAAQEPADTLVEVTLVDGSTLYGRILEDGDPVRILLVAGDELSVARARVRSIAPARGTVRDGEYWKPDPNLTRLFAAPTGRTMPRGQGYVAAYELLFPFVAVAVTDRLLIAAGTPLVGDIIDDRVFYVAPKFRVFSNERTDVALGGFFFFETDSYGGYDAGALYGSLTHGSDDNAVTLALGAAYERNGFFDDPAVMLGGEFRVARTIKIVTENYLVNGKALLAFGPRFFGERLSADLGMGIFIDENDAYVLPIVNFAYVW